MMIPYNKIDSRWRNQFLLLHCARPIAGAMSVMSLLSVIVVLFEYLLADVSVLVVLTRTPHQVVLPDAAFWQYLQELLPPLVLAQAASATVFARAPHSLVFTDAAAAAVFTLAPPFMATKSH